MSQTTAWRWVGVVVCHCVICNALHIMYYCLRRSVLGEGLAMHLNRSSCGCTHRPSTPLSQRPNNVVKVHVWGYASGYAISSPTAARDIHQPGSNHRLLCGGLRRPGPGPGCSSNALPPRLSHPFFPHCFPLSSPAAARDIHQPGPHHRLLCGGLRRPGPGVMSAA